MSQSELEVELDVIYGGGSPEEEEEVVGTAVGVSVHGDGGMVASRGGSSMTVGGGIILCMGTQVPLVGLLG